MGQDDIEDDLDTDQAPMVQRWVSVDQCQPFRSKAPCSVFELGSMARPLRIALVPITPRQEESIRRSRVACVIRDSDGVRYVNVRPEETEEWREREAARRARQIVPRPPRTAKTFGKRIRELGLVDD